jgi:hypothetical protein
MGLRVDVDNQHPRSIGCQARSQVDGGRGLSAATLLVHDRDYAHWYSPPAPPGRIANTSL